jgi:hypothetical protein
MALTQTEDKSVILRLYEDLETQLQTLIDDNTIGSVEVFNSQIDFESKERARIYPFVAIQITVEWEKPKVRSTDNENRKITQQEQNGICTVTIHHVFQSLKNETTAFKECEPIRHLVHRAVNEINDGNYYSKLLRITTLDDSSHDRVFDMMSIYQCGVTEPAYYDNKGKTKTDVTSNITTNLDVDDETIRSGDGEI